MSSELAVSKTIPVSLHELALFQRTTHSLINSPMQGTKMTTMTPSNPNKASLDHGGPLFSVDVGLDSAKWLVEFIKARVWEHTAHV